MITLEDLVEQHDGALLPPLDRSDCDERGLGGLQRVWRTDGAVILPGLLPDALVDAYVARYEEDGVGPHGYESPVAYQHVAEMRALCLQEDLGHYLDQLVGETMGVHLNLSGWLSTERNWHQDSYLNPPHVGSWYAAVWMALEDVDPDSGPFQFVPGSHRLPVVTRDRMLGALSTEEAASPDWPRFSERILTPLFENLIEREGLEVREFLALKGDVLIWHPRTLHRGSAPRVPGTPRRALIAHYSGLNHRDDMPNVAHENSRPYFVLAG